MRLLVTGAGGMLARAVLREAGRRGHDVAARDHAALDVTDREAVDREVRDLRPDAVLHCAAYTLVDAAEDEEDAAHAVNGEGAWNVARACDRIGAWIVYPSSDYVFDGQATTPYAPDAKPAPLNAYGRSKLAGEEAARECERHLIVRTSWLYGAGGRNFVASMLERARRGEALRVVADQHGSPTWTDCLARATLDLLESGAPPGIYHATNRGETTWYGLAAEAIRRVGLDVDIEPVATSDFPAAARRPAYSVLDCAATEAIVGPMARWETALAAALAEGVGG